MLAVEEPGAVREAADQTEGRRGRHEEGQGQAGPADEGGVLPTQVGADLDL